MRVVACFLMVLCSTFLFADDALTLGAQQIGKVSVMGFELDDPSHVTIRGTGGSFDGFRARDAKGRRGRAPLTAYAWILDSRSRAVVWHTFPKGKMPKKLRYEGAFKIDAGVNLEAGRYEVYYAAVLEGGAPSPGRSCTVRRYKKRDRDKLYVTVSAHRMRADNGYEALQAINDRAVAPINHRGDDEIVQQQFCLDREATVHVRALGEIARGEQFDYAWIEDVNNRRRVWNLEASDTEHAGGAAKNRVFDGELRLPKGKYKLYYVSDDSHSNDGWNALPPHDPRMWGVTLTPADRPSRRAVSRRTFREAQPALALTRMTNDSLQAQRFKIVGNADLRILCLAEGNRSGMLDRAYILDAETRAPVWTMRYSQSTHAGGSMANRVVDETLRLPKGEYIAVFEGDARHGFGQWNGGKPYNPVAWGLSIFPKQAARFEVMQPKPGRPRVDMRILDIAGDD